MKLLAIIKYTLISNFKDKKSLISFVIFPTIMILILGNALGAAFEPASLGEINVGVINDDIGNLGTDFIKFLKKDNISEVITVEEVESLEEGKSSLNAGKYSVIIHLNKDYTKNLTESKENKVTILSDNEGSYMVTVVKQIVDSYLAGVNAVYVAREYNPEDNTFKMQETVKDMGISVENNIPKAIDYYAVTILVMALIYGTAITAKEFEMNFKGNMGRRIRVSPIKPSILLISKILTSVIIIIIQGIIIMGISKVAYGANWGDNMLINLVIIALGAILSASLGILISLIINDPEKVGGFITVLIPIMTFASGGFVKASFFGLEYITPNYHIQNAFFNVIYSGDYSSIFNSLRNIIAFTIIIIIISLTLGRRKVEW